MLAKGVTILSDRTREIRGRPDDEGDGLVQVAERDAEQPPVLEGGRLNREHAHISGSHLTSFLTTPLTRPLHLEDHVHAGIT